MSDLDRSKPFGKVRGMPGVRYAQGGLLFTAQGKPYKADKTEASDVDAPADDYENMTWHQLRKLVQEAGGEWTNSKEAIAFLRSRDE
jgi:hypothetical protein